MKHATITGLKNRVPEKTFVEMRDARGDSLGNHAGSDDGEAKDDEGDQETELVKLSEDDNLGWVVGSILKMVLQCMERSGQKKTKFEELTQLERADASNYFHESDTQ
jgi:hypothetical protein